MIAERFFDESGGMQLVIHAPFGGRINKAWGLALRKRFCRSFNLELQAAATDDGINISLSEQHSFPMADVFRFLHPASVDHVLEQAVLNLPFSPRAGGGMPRGHWCWRGSKAAGKFRRRFNACARTICWPRFFPTRPLARKIWPARCRFPTIPLVREVMKDALTEAMDLEGLKQVLAKILDGGIKCLSVDTPMPSAFSHEILNANPYAYLDDAPLEERRARAVEMRRALPDTVASDIGRLDPSAIAEVRAEVWPDVRDTEELHDALASFVALPDISSWDVDGSSLADSGGRSTADFVYLQNAIRRSIPAWRVYFDELLCTATSGAG